MRKKTQSRSALRSPFDFDRQDGRQMEIEYFKSFQHFEREIQSDNFTHGEKQIPDFLVRVSDRVVGVEVTQLFKPKGGRDVESTQERILEEACRKAQEQELPHAHVTLFFNLRGPLYSVARSRIADAVVRVVAEQMPADGESVELERVPGQPREVDLITINRIHCYGPGRWVWLELGTIDRDAACPVQKAIARKAVLLSSYLKFCSECWLLLAADSFRASGKLAFDDSYQSRVFVSPFARTYVLEFGKGWLYRLRT
ncbi:MAG: hypothetical protein WA373_10880 [Burkholderiales bacterium]